MTRYTHCTYCGDPKKIPARQGGSGSKRGKTAAPSTYADPAIYETDPYCSRTCLEADLGIEDPRSPLISTSGRLGRQGQRQEVPA